MSYRRRIFWGHSLAQALSRAARYHGLPVEQLAWRLHEKRHGFVRQRRPVLVEVDPERPQRAAGAPPVAPAVETPGALSGPSRAPSPPPQPSRRAPPSEASPEAWDVPDEESVYAAAEAARRLLQLAGLELVPRVEIGEERLEISLAGADESRLATLGVALLDTLESMLPRAVMGLAGRHVRCRVDGVGLREAHERELRARAREAAAQVRASGERQLLGPLNPAERRIVHLELREATGVRTESLGRGFLKRLAVDPD